MFVPVRWLGVVAALVSCTNDRGGSLPDPAAGVGLDDVSVLLPLPTSLDDTNALRLDGLLSRASFDAIPVFADNPEPYRAYDRWRIVAARIDPCFPDLTLLASNPAACRRQLRLVAQPLEPTGFADDAIHLAYDFSESDHSELVERWLAIRTTATVDPTRPLGVHPTIAEQGLGGPVATELREIITAFASAARLSQITFVEGRRVVWEFGGLKVVGDQLVPMKIHGLQWDANNLQFTLNSSGVFDVDPPTAESRGLHALAGESDGHGGVTINASPDAIHTAMQLSLDIDNPTTGFNADSLDCSSCHMATRARHQATQFGAEQRGLVAFTSSRYDLTLDLPDTIAGSPVQQRAFGYKDGVAAWNQRTINETAAVAAYLAARY